MSRNAKTETKIFNWVILAFGIWVMASPVVFGSVGAVIFYSNIITGSLLLIFALKNIMGEKNVNI